MNIAKTLLCTIAVAASQNALADTEITLLINGEPVAKELTKLTFDSDLVTLTFSDNSSQTTEMGAVRILIDHEASSALESIQADASKTKGVYNIKGQYLGETPEGLQHGIYIINGQKVCIK